MHTIMLFAASVLCIGAIAMLLQASAESTEYTDEDYQRQLEVVKNYDLPDFCIDRSPPCIVEIRNMTQSVHRVVDDELIFEQRTIPAQFFSIPPDPALDGCTKAEGTIRWDAKFKNSKILPDLQQVIDSGAERLCITIMFNFDPKHSRSTTYLTDVENGIKGILSRNGVQIENAGLHIVWAAIPASLLDELVNSDLVANIDVYGKKDWLPLYVLAGLDSKFNPSLQREIDTGMKECTLPIIVKGGIISLLDEDYNPIPKEDYTVDYESQTLEYMGKRIIVLGPGPEPEHGLPYQYMPAKCPLDKNKDGKVVFNLSLLLPPVEKWPNGSPNISKMTREEWEVMRDNRHVEIAEIYAARQQPVVDLLESNGQTVLERGSSVNFIDADITADFLPRLEEVDAIEFIETINVIWTLDGCIDCDLTDHDEVPDNTARAEQFPSKTDIILNGNSAIINATMTVIPNSIPIPSEILGKDITVNINNRSVINYDIIESGDGSQLFLALHQDGQTETVKLNDKTRLIPSPRKQMADGVQSQDMMCGTGQYLAMLNDRTVCITDETAQIFTDRGFDIVLLS